MHNFFSMSVIKPDIDLLVKYASGECNPAEAEKLKHWLSFDADNQKELDKILLILAQTEDLSQPGSVDENTAWQSLQRRIESRADKPVTALFARPWVSAAAVVVVLISIFWIYRSSSGPGQKSVSIITKNISSGGKNISATLPDGSTVMLREHSSLDYPSVFAGNTRPVRLQGEGFFSIAHNHNKPFIISVSDILVTVVGTSFTIRSTDLQTAIVVRTGVVRINRKGRELELAAGDSITILQTDTALKKSTKDTLSAKVYPVTKGVAKPYEANLVAYPEKQKLLVRKIIADIIRQRLVKEKDSLVWFGLNDHEFNINGQKQTAGIYKAFKEKYLQAPGYGFYYGPGTMTGKGFFFTKHELEEQTNKK
jgi:transmembrane sensor